MTARPARPPGHGPAETPPCRCRSSVATVLRATALRAVVLKTAVLRTAVLRTAVLRTAVPATPVPPTGVPATMLAARAMPTAVTAPPAQTAAEIGAQAGASPWALPGNQGRETSSCRAVAPSPAHPVPSHLPPVPPPSVRTAANQAASPAACRKPGREPRPPSGVDWKKTGKTPSSLVRPTPQDRHARSVSWATPGSQVSALAILFDTISSAELTSSR